MLTLTVPRTADDLVRELEGRGLVMKLETTDGKSGGRHWHFGYPRRSGVLELTDLGDACELKVGAKRDGGWATDLAHELAGTAEH